MGIAPERFWRMTPLLFDERLKRLRARERQVDYRFGVIATLFANAHRDQKKHPRPFKPEAFFPSLRNNE